MPSNGYRRAAARNPGIPLINEVMGQGGNVKASESLNSVQKTMRQGGESIKRGQTAVPSVQETMRQGGRKKK